MTSKSVFYLFFIVIASFSISVFLRFKLPVEAGDSAVQFMLLNSMKLIVVPVFLLLIFEPILFIYKRYIKKITGASPKGWQFVDSIVESLFTYWIIYALIFFFFS